MALSRFQTRSILTPIVCSVAIFDTIHPSPIDGSVAISDKIHPCPIASPVASFATTDDSVASLDITDCVAGTLDSTKATSNLRSLSALSVHATRDLREAVKKISRVILRLFFTWEGSEVAVLLEVSFVADALSHRGVSSMGGYLYPRERDIVVDQFRSGSLKYLLTTDVASEKLRAEMVVYYDAPESVEVYTTRAARVCRGHSVTIAKPLDKNIFDIVRSH